MLTDTAVRKAKPSERAYKLTDGGGLHLFISPSGGKLWRYRYLFDGREKTLSIGPYPEIPLADARSARDQAKRILKEGRDPSQVKKTERLSFRAKTADTFEAIAREWFDITRARWTPIHASDVLTSLERDVFPAIGFIPIRDITPPEALAVTRMIEARGAAETAGRIRQRMSAVFVYAIATGRGESDPAAIIKGALAPKKKGRQRAITDLDEARKIIRDVDASPGYAVTKLAIRLLALTAVRPGVITLTPWHELPAGATVWTIPASRMKMTLDKKSDAQRDHLVPLSRQAIQTIEALRTITGRGPMAFPNTRHVHKPMSENAMGYMLNRAGYHHRHVPHGWRSTFSTIMNERYPSDRHVIDLMLAHTPTNAVEGAYNRAQHIARRTELSQIWADLISDGLNDPIDLLSLPCR